MTRDPLEHDLIYENPAVCRRSRWAIASARTTEAELTFLHKLEFQNILSEISKRFQRKWRSSCSFACVMHVFKRLRITADTQMRNSSLNFNHFNVYLQIPEENKFLVEVKRNLRNSLKRQENYDFLPVGWTARIRDVKGLEQCCVGSSVADVCGISFTFLNDSLL